MRRGACQGDRHLVIHIGGNRALRNATAHATLCVKGTGAGNRQLRPVRRGCVGRAKAIDFNCQPRGDVCQCIDYLSHTVDDDQVGAIRRSREAA